MADTYDQESVAPTTLAALIEDTTYMPGKQKQPCCPPAIDPIVQLKWGLALLGEEKATEYIRWLQLRLDSFTE